MSFQSFEDLIVWQKGRAFRKNISVLVKTFPKEEKYRLCDQLIRASRSITANIAEGHGRFHFQENIQFVRMARASLSECLEHLICALDEKYISDEELESWRKKYKELEKLHNGYISYLRKRKDER